MKKKFFITIILSLAIILSSCSMWKGNTSSSGNASKLSKEQWMEDINYLEKYLAAWHINIYHTITKEEYEKEFNNLKKEVPKLNDMEIKMKLAKIVASVGDAHTEVDLGLTKEDKFYPLSVYWFGKELKVLYIDKQYKSVIGNDLIAINNIPISEAFTRINTLIPHENEQWLKYRNVSCIQMPDVLKFLNIVKEDKAVFTFSDDKGNITKLNLTPKVIKKENIVYAKDLTPIKPVRYQHDDSNYYDNLFWYKYIPEDKIMYFQYNQCIDKDYAMEHGYKDYEKYPDFNKFMDELLKELQEKQIDKFIIDLRNNTGGDDGLMNKFVGKICSDKKINKRGKIFVIAGRGTISSGVLACLSLKNFTKAIFCGEPTGGNVNCYGETGRITLPNSKIQVLYSSKYFKDSADYKEGFTPDIPVEQSFNNYINGIDDAYEAIKNYKN